MKTFWWLVLVAVALCSGCSRKQEKPAEKVQTQAEPASPPPVEAQIPGGPLDGNWWKRAPRFLRWGVGDGLIDCMSVDKGIQKIPDGSVEDVNQKVSKYYAHHPAGTRLEDAIQAVGRDIPAEPAPQPAKETTKPAQQPQEEPGEEEGAVFTGHSYFSGIYWAQAGQERIKSEGYLLGYMYCRTGTVLTPEEVGKTAAKIDEFYAKFPDEERKPIADVLETIGALPSRKK